MGQTLRKNGVVAGNITKEMMEDMLQKLIERDRSDRNKDFKAGSAKTNNSTFALHLWSDGKKEGDFTES